MTTVRDLTALFAVRCWKSGHTDVPFETFLRIVRLDVLGAIFLKERAFLEKSLLNWKTAQNQDEIAKYLKMVTSPQ